MIKYFISIGLSILTFVSFGQSEHPELANIGKKISDLTPDGWDTLASTIGDLNRDGIDDLVFAIKNTDNRNFKLNDGLGSDSTDLNPRILAIYFGDSSRTFKKQLQSNEFILLKESPTIDEPFDGLTIQNNGILKMNYSFWSSAGSWYMSNHEYKFRYQNDRFELIGYEETETHRGTMKSTNYSINFSTKKMKTVVTTFDENTEEEKSSVRWKKFELVKLKSISSLRKPFEWTFLGIEI